MGKKQRTMLLDRTEGLQSLLEPRTMNLPTVTPMVEMPVEVLPPVRTRTSAPVRYVAPVRARTSAPVRYVAPTDEKPAVKITFDKKFLTRDPADYNDFERAVLSWWAGHKDRQHHMSRNPNGSVSASWRAKPRGCGCGC